MSRALELAFSFEPECLTGNELVSIVVDTNFMVPAEIMLDREIPYRTTFEPHHLQSIRSAHRPIHVALTTSGGILYDGGPYLHLISIERYQCLYIRFSDVDRIPLDLLNSLSCKAGFRAGTCHDSWDTFWQGEHDIECFKRHRRSYEHLPQAWDDDLKVWGVDISRNPARRHGIADMWLQAAWRMWFGEEAFKHIPKEVLLSFPDAQEITTLPCGTVFIQLFDDPFAFDTPENRRRQQAFLDHVQMDLVVEKDNSEVYGDCHYEQHEGNFEYGGTLRSIRWTNDEGKTVLRSRATQMEIREFVNDKLIKRWFEPAPRTKDDNAVPPS